METNKPNPEVPPTPSKPEAEPGKIITPETPQVPAQPVTTPHPQPIPADPPTRIPPDEPGIKTKPG